MHTLRNSPTRRWLVLSLSVSVVLHTLQLCNPSAQCRFFMYCDTFVMKKIVFVCLANQHWFNMVPGLSLGIACKPTPNLMGFPSQHRAGPSLNYCLGPPPGTGPHVMYSLGITGVATRYIPTGARGK